MGRRREKGTTLSITKTLTVEVNRPKLLLLVDGYLKRQHMVLLEDVLRKYRTEPATVQWLMAGRVIKRSSPVFLASGSP